eukprot:7379351-Prymnesium_polylepis.1
MGLGDHVLIAPLILDANVKASEIWIIGEHGASLRGEGGDAVLTIRTGSPRVHLVGLHIYGLRIFSEGGDLRIKDTMFGGALDSALNSGRKLDGSHEQPALTVNGGNVDIFRGQFSHLNGGAISVTSGSLNMDNSTFTGNRAVKGGAILVTGGRAHLKRVLFRRNRAETTGGALQVDGGVVELSSETYFIGNRAPQGASLCVCLLKQRRDPLLTMLSVSFRQLNGGELSYIIPAPLAHYIYITDGSNRTQLTSTDTDYPFPCSPGVVGATKGNRDQSGPQCSHLCPEGFFCPMATSIPKECHFGSYCPRGSPAPLLCPAGTVGTRNNLTHVEDCEPCPRGTSILPGSSSPQPCADGFYATNASSATCTSCPPGTHQDVEGQTECKPCPEGKAAHIVPHACLPSDSRPEPMRPHRLLLSTRNGHPQELSSRYLE